MTSPASTLSTVRAIMQSEGVPCWIMYSAEHSDPYFGKLITPRTTVPAIASIGLRKCYLMVHELEVDNVRTLRGVDALAHRDGAAMWQNLGTALRQLRFPEMISLNYSATGNAQVDVLGAGMFRILTQRIRRLYSGRGLKVRFCSSENMVYALGDRKNPRDIRHMRLAARRALEILETTFGELRPGMSELDAAALVHKVMMQKPSYLRTAGVVAEECAWEKEDCPIVLAGPSLKKGGHAMPSRRRIARGDTVYFDFGVKLAFADGTSWCSDIQRMGYVLKPGETQAPPDVKRMFETLVEAIRKGMLSIRPGMRGHEVDTIVRNHIRDAGYPDYNHATGHAVGELSHNPGALLGPRSRAQSNLRVQPNGVYTLEPRIAIVNGGSVEEMVVVGEHGGRPLCSPQESLYFVK